jgi:phytoene/squalene synthetase
MNEQYLSIFNSIDFKKIIDHPNILIAAAFWDNDRYQAARTCYKYMRAIDDLIDCHKSTHKVIAENEKNQFIENVNRWIALARDANNSGSNGHELLDTIRTYHIPIWPLEAFAKSMIYDINHDGFRTLDDFIQYSLGASVAPASIFVHLSGLTRIEGNYTSATFDVRSAATPCAMFSYLVHIIRDFQKDQLNNLNYFADDLLAKNQLLPADLMKMANGGQITEGFRGMIREYLSIADKYRQLTYRVIQDIWPLLESRYRLSLLIIFNLYLMVFERIDPEKGNFSAEELNPTTEEIRKRVYETIIGFKE